MTVFSLPCLDIHGNGYTIRESFTDLMPSCIPHQQVEAMCRPRNALRRSLTNVYRFVHDMFKSKEVVQAESSRVFWSPTSNKGLEWSDKPQEDDSMVQYFSKSRLLIEYRVPGDRRRKSVG